MMHIAFTSNFMPGCLPSRSETKICSVAVKGPVQKVQCRPRMAATWMSSSAGESAAVTVPKPPVVEPSCFGVCVRFPRRVVGLYELERAGINPYRVFDDGNKRNDAAFAAVVGAFVLALTAVPLWLASTSSGAASQLEGPVSLAAGGLLTLWAVDALAFNSAFAGAASSVLQPRTGVAAHEAGHFLTAYLLGLPVTSYSLPSDEAFQKLFQHQEDVEDRSSVSSGVQIDFTKVADVYDVVAVGMAGVAAECREYGSSEGGSADLADVCRVVRSSPRGSRSRTQKDASAVARWGLLRAALLLSDQRPAHRALTTAMAENRSVEDCILVIEANFDWSKVERKGS